jgi:hypothetical protein
MSDQKLMTALASLEAEEGVLYSKEFAKFQPMSSEPLEGEVSSDVRITRRARAVLSGRTDDQVKYIAEFSDYIAEAIIVSGRVIAVSEDGSEKGVMTVQTALSMANPVDLVKVVCDVVRKSIEESDDGKFSIGLKNEDDSIACYVDSLTEKDVLAANALVQAVRAFQFGGLSSGGCWHPAAMAALECVVLAERAASDIATNTLLERYRLLRAVRADDRLAKALLEITDEQIRQLDALFPASESQASPEKTEDFRLTVRREIAVNAANGRWGRLTPVKDKAVELFRKYDHLPSRAAAVRKIEAEVRDLARAAGFPLSEENGRNTIDQWVTPHDPRAKA